MKYKSPKDGNMPSVHTNNSTCMIRLIPATSDLEHAFGRSLNPSVQERALWVEMFWAVVLGAVTDHYLVQSGLQPPDCVGQKI